VDREVDTAPEPRYEGDTLIIPVVEEMLVTEKRLLLREEVRITRRQRTEQAEIRDVLRREIVDVEEHPAQAGGDLTP
jgi:stress response protein YsnF